MNRLASEYRGDMYVQYVNIDQRQNRPLVDAYGVEATPTMFILNDQGEIVAQYRGLTPESMLRQGIEQGLAASTGSPTTAKR